MYGLPPDPVVPTRDLIPMWRSTAIAAGAFLLAGITAFARGGRR